MSKAYIKNVEYRFQELMSQLEYISKQIDDYYENDTIYEYGIINTANNELVYCVNTLEQALEEVKDTEHLTFYLKIKEFINKTKKDLK